MGSPTLYLTRSGRVGTIPTSAAEVRDRSRAAHGAFYATISLSGYGFTVCMIHNPGQEGDKPYRSFTDHARLMYTECRNHIDIHAGRLFYLLIVDYALPNDCVSPRGKVTQHVTANCTV